MILLIDIGNTHTKYIDANFLSKKSVGKVANSQLTTAWLNQHWENVNKIVLASVNQTQLTKFINDWAHNNGIEFVEILTQREAHGVVNGYQIVTQLGVDRWLALVGANAIFPQKNILIVDAGTATTIDFLDVNGQHYGGWILPGIDSMISAVLDNTANVSANRNEQASLLFANNTSDNVNHASWAATVGAIYVAKNEIKKLNVELDLVLITGGNAPDISNLCDFNNHIEEQLIFTGLKQYLD
jgi:type III pantothenate kinase